MQYIYIFILTILSLNIHAQSVFVKSGKVLYEKRINQHKRLSELGENNEWIQIQLKETSKVTSDEYELQFTTEKSIYKLSKDNSDNKYTWGNKPSDNDIITKNLNNNTINIQRDVFEQTYLLQDSLRNLTWRISDETRTIAGFECKKAVTKICDSVYVVAFFSTQIIPSTGPESFSGLPGLILGLAVPRLHTTWFATKVVVTDPETINQQIVKTKGKKTTWLQLHSDLQKATKDWGKESARLIWNFML